MKKKIKKVLTGSALMLAFSLLPTDAEAAPFLDAQGPAIDYVYQHNIMTGIDENHFGSQENLKRGDFVYLLYRIHQEETSPKTDFVDVSENAYYAQAVNWAVDKGIIYGRNAQSFDPDGFLTVEETAAIMERYAEIYIPHLSYSTHPLDPTYQVSNWAQNAVIHMQNYFNDLSQPQAKMTRGEISEVIYKMQPITEKRANEQNGTIKNGAGGASRKTAPPASLVKAPTKKGTTTPPEMKTITVPGTLLPSGKFQLASGRIVDAKIYKKMEDFHKANKLIEPDEEKKMMFDKINEIRRQAKVPTLKYGQLLEKMAEKRIDEAAGIKINAGIYENPHKRSYRGDSFVTIVKDFGYPEHQFILGENITTRKSSFKQKPSYTAAEGFKSLYDSPSHLENMLNPSFTHVGIADYNHRQHHLWLQLFIKDELEGYLQ